ncbi:putative RNA-directed DNA polymerase from transposon X-element [Trichonephila clavipes]|uniref:Putative RNA-directed DNA polymerase from transposon X-element n=1 Tax=Trichonephila clavipes TaxID=2585209 RepID=A0A8X6VEI6_TRICX|nr:putative RNA-directed DNA polymerase from transposon X-element [Trichonephila clavipes]
MTDYERLIPSRIAPSTIEVRLQQQLDEYCQQRDRKAAQNNDKRRKQKEPKKKATDPPPKETDNDRRHKEIQKYVKRMAGRLSFLEHCIKSEKEFPDLTDDAALVGYQKDYDELASLKEHKLGFPQLRRQELAGKYLKIFTTTSDEHRILTDYLDEKREEFYVINPLNSRPQKVVIKGLPVSTEIGEIQADLTSQGFCVEKVAQLTRSKTKSPLPIFMVELKRISDSPDIFQLKKCCYLAVQVKTFSRRPGVSQCYNCNLFNHSSKNCHMRTGCLCGESHRTSNCPIKEKITNPICINCYKAGHMANWSQCEEFPKRKQKKGETITNRNIIKETEIKKPFKPVTPNLCFAAALSGAPNKNKNPGTLAATEEAPRSNENNSNENYFGFNDAIIELRRFFFDYPFLLEMGDSSGMQKTKR